MTTRATAGHALERIHVTRWGSGAPIVLVHGGGQGDPAGGDVKWAFQRPLADRGFELVVPDRPGMGRSPSQGPDDFELDGPWAGELLGDGAHLVGHSYGGAIALCAAGLRPKAVRSLTLIEAPIFSAAAGRPEAARLAAQLRDAMSARLPIVGAVKGVKVLGIPRDRSLGERPPLGALRAMARGFRAMRHPDTWDAEPALAALRDVGVGVLFVEGGWSPGFQAIGEAVVRRTDGELLRIPAGHHLAHAFQEGRPFNEALERVIASASSERS